MLFVLFLLLCGHISNTASLDTESQYSATLEDLKIQNEKLEDQVNRLIDEHKTIFDYQTLLDEAQHQTAQTLAELLKDLADATGTSVLHLIGPQVLIGQGELTNPVTSSQQIPWGPDTDPEQYNAGNALDGNNNTWASTKWQPRPWFKADLVGGPQMIRRIVLQLDRKTWSHDYRFYVLNGDKVELCADFAPKRDGIFTINVGCFKTGTGFKIQGWPKTKGSRAMPLVLNNVQCEVTVDPDETPDEGTDETPDEGTDETPDEGTDETPDEGTDETPDEGTDETPDEGTDETPDENSSECIDEKGSICTSYYTSHCENGKFDDGTHFWAYCMNSCSCCDGSCAAEQARKDAEQAKQDAACGEKLSEGPSTSFFRTNILAYHNTLRAEHQNTEPMTWNYTLQGYAQTHCDQLAASRVMYHSSREDRGYSGENLYMSGLQHGVCEKVGGLASQAWYDEIEFYDYSTGGKKMGDEAEMIGHFTQLVWTDSTRLGCAYSLTSSKDQVYVCCNYDPSGNYNNNALNKVKPLKQSAPSVA